MTSRESQSARPEDESKQPQVGKLASLRAPAPLTDGRQSERALEIGRGAGRLLRSLGFSLVNELTLADWRRADIMAVSDKGDIWIVEIKSSLADFRADQKWQDYWAYCDRFFFAVMPEFPREVLPEDAGLIIADRYGAEIVRQSQEERLPGARRKAVILRFARAAALRLQSILDPDCGLANS
jgi:hypothetical protein